jgi:undecaprenyl diphosphate synthase
MIPSLASLNHLAIIMDGNGRWAKGKNLDRMDIKKELSLLKKLLRLAQI